MSNFDRVLAVLWVLGFVGCGPFIVYTIFGWTCTIGFVVFLFILFWLGYENRRYVGKGQKESSGSESWGAGWSDSWGSYDYGDGGGGWGGGGDCGGGDGGGGGGDCGGE